MPTHAEWSAAIRLFVYGTLMHDGCRSGVLASATYLRSARTLPNYVLLDLGEYPGMVAVTSGGRTIVGELYEVAPGLLPLLDEVEGAPELFRLSEVALEGTEGPVHAYFFQGDPVGVPVYRYQRWDNGCVTKRGASR